MIERVRIWTWKPRWWNSKMRLEAVIVQVWRCIWRPRWCNSEMHLEAKIKSNSDIHLEAVFERVWRCTWRPRLCNSEMQLEAVIVRLWKCTWRPWSIKIGGELGRGWSGGNRSGGRCNGSWDSIHWLTHNFGKVESWVQWGPPRYERLAGSGVQSNLGWYSTQCMQYSVYAVLGVNPCPLHGEIDRDDSTSCS